VTYEAHPVKGAFVLVSGPEPLKAALTDAQGHFDLHGKMPGRYSIRVQKEELPDPCSKMVSLSSGSRIDPMDFEIQKGGVISGRVMDRQKQPIEGLHVEAMSKAVSRNGVVLSTKSEALTNDRGEYRMSRLAMASTWLRCGRDLRKSRSGAGARTKELRRPIPC